MSDDDEGITAVEAAGGQSVQLQRVQCAVVLTFCKHPEDGAAHMRLAELVPGRHILGGGQTRQNFAAVSLSLFAERRVSARVQGDKRHG